MAETASIPPGVLLAGYCLLILVASLAGGWIPLLVRLTHTRLQVATSFVAGLMLGVGLLHMLPHAWHETRSIDGAVAWLMAGFLVMFFIQRFFHFHHHDVPEEAPELAEACGAHDHAGAEHGHDHDHPPQHGDAHHAPTLAEKSARRLSWGGAAFGLTFHTLIDGIALAASVKVESLAGSPGVLMGLGTFLVIILHKPFDAMAIGTLMARGGWSPLARHIVNGLFALAIPVGVVCFHWAAKHSGEQAPPFLGAALAFAAGTFVCIATIDLLPELQFHAHDRVKLSVALLAGVGLAALIGRFETTGHDRHQMPPPEAITEAKPEYRH
jgi:zinc and cadmium transporter